MPTYWSCWSRWRNASMNRPDVSVQRRTRLPDLHFQFFELFVVDVIKPPRHVETVADLRKRCASSIEKLKLFLFMIAGATFNDVYRDRESGAARLRREFECQMRTAMTPPMIAKGIRKIGHQYQL